MKIFKIVVFNIFDDLVHLVVGILQGIECFLGCRQDLDLDVLLARTSRGLRCPLMPIALQEHLLLLLEGISNILELAARSCDIIFLGDLVICLDLPTKIEIAILLANIASFEINKIRYLKINSYGTKIIKKIKIVY